MKIALIGYGKMGKAIHEIAKEKNERLGKKLYDISLIIDIDNRKSITKEDLKKVDVAIEFTSPHTAVDNIKWCFDADVPVVVGSTGWTEKLDNIKQIALDNNKSFLFAPNFSIGVNVFFEINRILAKIMNDHEEYDVTMEEIHHTEKKDSPSGTALYAALDVIQRMKRKSNWENMETRDASTLSIISKRIDNVPGTHTVTYESSIDRIDLTHTAHNRKGFASGALLAAEWLQNKKGVFTMEDVLGFNKH
ncbi:MAG TPA: 4-hydroxy-tetrahydrodipicolinate reductase [Chitinophagales bacterium]|jgi:4-hydroxy-tetrahydrodipicolinate reductase|nr:4-hydroxy-tetrahydrodipicolinate reductase [Chitinophagales bacterium]MBP6154667.1 4-hydroxy-tetrahydrodipicolinate reductase [Chitinophagales bacterium]HQV77490.1 4-hydroxy-tetrahydrodipicolinate reductase [Chitinophagales bacterium]HQW78552.1 4-hydroxy-tetrahydrodipicolinate reductase [Chitinophagales bacterium]HRB66732.1 4-hydroxy-tetrahydrodipicolinate reductase [Chitinophagales bacterium]